ncbi:MAG TPA: MaoC family dehydratase [Anaeromyxobacteraceae bacterium]
MAVLTRQLYFEGVKVGDELPPLVKPPVDRIQIARYAGASQDYSPLHVDEQFARNSGFPTALAPGMLAMGFLGELVVDWLRGARLRRFSARFVKIVWPGDVITCRGRVVDRRFEEPGRYAVDIEAWAENQRGELVVRGLVTAQPYYSAEDETRQRAGQPPLVVTAQEEEARLARLTRGLPPRRPEQARPGAVASRPAPAPARKAAPAKPVKGKKPAGARKPARPAKAKRPARPRKAARPGKPARRPVRPARARPRARKPAARSRPRSAKRR